MANIADCLETAFKGGELSRAHATAAQDEFRQLADRFASSLPRAQAEAEAARVLKEASRASAAGRRHTVLAQLQTMVRLAHDIETSADPARALRNLVEYTEGSGYTGESIVSLERAYIQSINAGIEAALKGTRRNLLGKSRDPALLRNIIRELHGEAAGDEAAAQIAAAVRHTQERLRLLFNAHGGNLDKLEDFGLSHSHNVVRMRQAGQREWTAQIRELLDWTRIIDHSTGNAFATTKGAVPPEAVTATFLQDVWKGLTTRGWDTREPSMSTGGRALYNARADHRVLHFTGGDAWLQYNAAFGSSDPFTAMVGGLHSLGSDIARMRVLGPNPRAGLEFAAQAAQSRASNLGDTRLEARVETAIKQARTMLSHASGAANVPEHLATAAFFGGVRHTLASAQLGSAMLSSATDIATMRSAATELGMDRSALMKQAMLLATSPEARAQAASLGYVAETLAEVGATMARYAGDSFGPELTKRLSAATFRLSGLSFWTDMNRIAFRMEFAAMLGQSAGKTFDQLHPQLRTAFARRGIGAADWDRLRAAENIFSPREGTAFISPDWMRTHSGLPAGEAEGLAMRLSMLVEEQLEYAVPTAKIGARAALIGDTAPGSFSGELLRSGGMYKGFTFSFTLGQYARMMQRQGVWNRALYAVRLGGGMFVLGALAVQIKQLARGDDPRPMYEPKFLAAALLQSGGIGIFGDFFASANSRVGGGVASTLAGPAIGLIGDVTKLTAGNVIDAGAGRDMHLGRDLAQFAGRYTPVASSLWYARAAYQRMVIDQLQNALDPEAEANWRRQTRQRERDYGTRSWWQRGEMLPDRAPDLANTIGARP